MASCAFNWKSALQAARVGVAISDECGMMNDE
jgi:hypothetical protein